MRAKKSVYEKIAILIALTICIFLISYKEDISQTWNSWGLPLSKKVIVLDPGHGGIDGGASSGNVLEKDIALSIAKKLCDKLQQQGAIVIMTRNSDRDLAPIDMEGIRNRKEADLRARRDIINKKGVDMYLSIHLNATPSPEWSGAQVFYNPKLSENKMLARVLQKQLVDTLENTTRKHKSDTKLFILKEANVPGVMAEVGFISNDKERQLLQNDVYQEKISLALYTGIITFLTEK